MQVDLLHECCVNSGISRNSNLLITRKKHVFSLSLISVSLVSIWDDKSSQNYCGEHFIMYVSQIIVLCTWNLYTVCVCVFSCVQLFATPWTVARQAPLSMGFSRKGYWSGLPFPPLGDLPNLGTEFASFASSALTGRFFTIGTTWETLKYNAVCQLFCFPGGTSGKEPAYQFRRNKRHRFDPWVQKIPWRRVWQLPPAFLPGESHGQKSLAGCSP